MTISMRIIFILVAATTAFAHAAQADSGETHAVPVPSRLQGQNLTLFYGNREYPLRKTLQLRDTGAFSTGILRDGDGRIRGLINKWASPNFLKHADVAQFYVQPSLGVTQFAGEAFENATYMGSNLVGGVLEIGTYQGGLMYFFSYGESSARDTTKENSYRITSSYRSKQYQLGVRYIFPHARLGAIQEMSLLGGPTLIFHDFNLGDTVTSIRDDGRNYGAFAGGEIATTLGEMLLVLRAVWTTQHIKADAVGLDDQIVHSTIDLSLRFFVR